MLRRKKLMTWFQKSIHSLLIVCLGGIGSLTYFDGFLPGHEHGEHPYHWVVFAEPAHSHNPLPPPPEVQAARARSWLVMRLNPYTDFLNVAQAFEPGFARFFTTGLSSGYILTAAGLKTVPLPCLLGSVVQAVLTGRSAWLPPPHKPPIFLA